MTSILRKLKKDLGDVFFLFLLQGVNYLIPLLVMPYLMIVLGVEKYGYIGFSQAYSQYFILLIDFGFNLSATKRIAQNRDNPNELSKIFYSTLYAKTALFLFSTFIYFIFILAIPPLHLYKKVIYLTYPMLIGSTYSCIWFYQGIGKIRVYSLMDSISKILLLPLTFLLVKNNQDYTVAACITSAVYCFTAILSLSYLWKLKVVSFYKLCYKDVKTELAESFPLFLSTASISMYTQLFTVILGLIAPPATVGKYTAAEKIMRSICFLLFKPVNQVYFPKIAYLGQKSRLEAKHLLNKVLYATGILMLIVFLFLFFGGKYISYFLGKDYQGISGLLKIMAIGPFFISCGALLGQIGLIALGDNTTKRQFRKTYFIAAPFSLLSVVVFTPFLFDTGASIALILTEGLVFTLMLYYCRKNQ